MRCATIIAILALTLLPQKIFAVGTSTCTLSKAVYKPRQTDGVVENVKCNKESAYLHPGDISYYFVITKTGIENKTQSYRLHLPYGCYASGITGCNLRFPNERLGVMGLESTLAEVGLSSTTEASHALAIPLLQNKLYYTQHDQLANFAKAEGRPEDKPVGSGLDLWIFDHCAE